MPIATAATGGAASDSRDAMHIDGSTMEGGGQILRTAAALSCILGKPFTLSNIRANRPKPGLQAQHLAGLLALSQITGAKTTGLSIGSTFISFSPGPIHAGEYAFSVGTAGAITLIAQSLLPVLLFAPAPSKIIMAGGTHVPFSPTFDYFEHVLLPTIHHMGCRASASLLRPGWYPKGGGKAELSIEPIQKPLHPLFSSDSSAAMSANPKQSALTSIRPNLAIRPNLTIHGISLCSNLPPAVAERQASEARKAFQQANITVEVKPADSPGSSITLIAEIKGESAQTQMQESQNSPHSSILGASALGKLGKPAEAVGQEAALALQREISSGAEVDAHLSDQLMLFAALAEGESLIRTSEITSHARTNAWLIERFTGRKLLIDDASKTIHVIGLGHMGHLSRASSPD